MVTLGAEASTFGSTTDGKSTNTTLAASRHPALMLVPPVLQASTHLPSKHVNTTRTDGCPSTCVRALRMLLNNMFNSILVPLDRSALAECVLPHAIALARAFDSHISLLQVIDAPRSANLTSLVDPLEATLASRSRKLSPDHLTTVESIRGSYGQPAFTAKGAAAEQIIEASNASRSDLIILSSHEQSGLTGWNAGSVTQKVALRAYTSLMIVRAYQTMPDEASNINACLCPWMVHSSGCALPVAAGLATRRAHIVLAHVVHRPEIPRLTPLTREDNELSDRYVENSKAKSRQYLLELRNRLPGDAGARDGERTRQQLHELASQENVDLVLAGAHGYSSQSRWPFGSVVSSFITYGMTPLLIVQDVQDAPLHSNGAASTDVGHGFNGVQQPVMTEVTSRGIRDLQGTHPARILRAVVRSLYSAHKAYGTGISDEPVLKAEAPF